MIAVPAPARCACGGALDVEKIESQYQHEIVRKTVWKRFDVTICSLHDLSPTGARARSAADIGRLWRSRGATGA